MRGPEHLQSSRPQATNPLITCGSWVQANAYDQEKVDWLISNCGTNVEIFQGLCKVYAERPMYGYCMPGSDEWQTISYKQVHERVVSLAAGAQLLTSRPYRVFHRAASRAMLPQDQCCSPAWQHWDHLNRQSGRAAALWSCAGLIPGEILVQDVVLKLTGIGGDRRIPQCISSPTC